MTEWVTTNSRNNSEVYHTDKDCEQIKGHTDVREATTVEVEWRRECRTCAGVDKSHDGGQDIDELVRRLRENSEPERQSEPARCTRCGTGDVDLDDEGHCATCQQAVARARARRRAGR
jgi:hypothetical protein